MKKYMALGFLVLMLLVLSWGPKKKTQAETISSVMVKKTVTQAKQFTQKMKLNPKLMSQHKKKEVGPSSHREVASVTEKVSLKKMAKIMYQFTRPDAQLEDLVKLLEVSHQRPQMTIDKNPYTGEMAIVRTHNPMDGTRYFHAQHFSNEGKNGIVQHVSFEFKPGPTAMNDALAAVKEIFQLGDAPYQKDGYAKWDIGNNQILWIKKMTAEDLQVNPFNAYSKDDIGTIRIAVEQEIHEG